MFTQDLNQLKVTIEKIHPLHAAVWEEFLSMWKTIKVNRKSILSYAQSIEQSWFYNLQGTQHLFYQNEDGREVSIEFIYKDQFGGNLESLLLQKPSKFVFEAMTKSKLLFCRAVDLKKMMDIYLDVEILVRKILTMKLENLQQHLIEVQCYTAKEKCERVLNLSPELLQNVPQKYIANHLGLHATNFSKFKKGWNVKNR